MVLVSHDLGQRARALCKQVLWLEKGEIRALGPTEEIVAQYLDDVNDRRPPKSERAIELRCAADRVSSVTPRCAAGRSGQSA